MCILHIAHIMNWNTQINSPISDKRVHFYPAKLTTFNFAESFICTLFKYVQKDWFKPLLSRTQRNLLVTCKYIPLQNISKFTKLNFHMLLRYCSTLLKINKNTIFFSEIARDSFRVFNKIPNDLITHYTKMVNMSLFVNKHF